jgi:hypothetical protein
MKKSRRHSVKPPGGSAKQFAVSAANASDCIAWMDQLGWNSDPRDDRGELLPLDYDMFMYTTVKGAEVLIVTIWDRRKAVLFKLAWSGK